MISPLVFGQKVRDLTYVSYFCHTNVSTTAGLATIMAPFLVLYDSYQTCHYTYSTCYKLPRSIIYFLIYDFWVSKYCFILTCVRLRKTTDHHLCFV